MPSLSPTAPSKKRSAAPASPPVLFALSDEERRLFFPADLRRERPGAEWAEVRGLGRQAWQNLLGRHQPVALVTGWCTPVLDFKHTLAGGGSVTYVCHVAGSVRHVVTRESIVEGLKVSNWGVLIAPQVAEHALLLILGLLRNVGLWRGFMQSAPDHQQKERLATRSLHGKRVAIHGFGAIARELIHLLRPFGVKIHAFSAGVPDAFIVEHGATPARDLRDLAGKAEVFVTCEALTPATRRAIDGPVLAALPEGAVFVNVGRGAVVDEEALAEAARTRGLRVGADVFTHEPLPTDSPLFQLPGAMLSPHIAGPALDAYAACGRHALANLDRFLAGDAPEGLITPEIFDRST